MLDQAEALDRMLRGLEASASATNNCEKFLSLLLMLARHLLDWNLPLAVSRAQRELLAFSAEAKHLYLHDGAFTRWFLTIFAGAAGGREDTLFLAAALLIWRGLLPENIKIRSADLDARWSPYLLIEASARQKNRKMKSAILG